MFKNVVGHGPFEYVIKVGAAFLQKCDLLQFEGFWILSQFITPVGIWIPDKSLEWTAD